MSEGKPKRQSTATGRSRAAKAMPRWKAWSIIAFFLGLTAALLWLGLAIVVRCDRVAEGAST